MVAVSLKPGVRLTNLVPQMAVALTVVASVFEEYQLPCVITSANDSQHGPRTLHHCREGKYSDGMCRALDFRTKYTQLDNRETQFRDNVKTSLGNDFNVVIESIGTDNEHLHVEYDPLFK